MVPSNHCLIFFGACYPSLYKQGDIAGMGADLFGSFAESTCAALVIAAAAVEDSNNTLSTAGWDAMLFPVAISAAGSWGL